MNRQIISTLFGLLAISLAGQASAYTAVDYHPYACHLIGSNGQGIQPYYNVNIGTISNISGASVIAVCPLHEVSTNTQHIYYVDGNGISGCNVCWNSVLVGYWNEQLPGRVSRGLLLIIALSRDSISTNSSAIGADWSPTRSNQFEQDMTRST